jgi:hypothetical protein
MLESSTLKSPGSVKLFFIIFNSFYEPAGEYALAGCFSCPGNAGFFLKNLLCTHK